MTKIFSVLCFVLALTALATLRADAEALTMEPNFITSNRRLLSEPAASLGQKASAGADDVNDATSNEGKNSAETKTGSDADKEDADDVNPSYGSYGQSIGSSPETHHYFTDDHRPRNF